jgi:arylsulfatase A-like enzyme/Flp pilus assembly protein TadD
MNTWRKRFRSAVIIAVGIISVISSVQAAETNLLLVTIDTLRPDRLSCYSTKYARTPAIDALAARGALFERAFAHNPITLASHANILLGTTPLYHGVSENAKTKVSDAFLTLAELLKSQGYATGAFVGAFPLDSRFGLNQGFDVYDDSFPTKSAIASIYPERKAELVIDPALSWLARQTGKWFCWIHLWDPHAPYAPPEPFLKQFSQDPYSGEVAYVDSQLARVFANLQKRGWTERTLVVLTADHGEALGEHGELTHSYFAYNSTLHVPLIMAGPGLAPSRIAEDVCHVDIFPTVCDLLAVKKPAALQGESLVPLMKGQKIRSRPIYFESLEPYLNKGCAPLRGYIEDSVKFVDTGVPELYDLSKDFDESTNLAPKTDLSPYRKKLEDMESALSSPMKKERDRPAGRQTLEKLRSLGYVASPVSQVKVKYGPEDDVKNFLPFQQQLERAIMLADEGKAEDALREATELVAKRPDFAAAYTFLSQTYVARGQVRDAILLMDGAVRKNPDNYSLLSAYGTLLVETAQYDRADEILQKALAILDFDPEVWDNLGIVRMRNGDYAKALEYYEKAISLDKTFALAYSNIGAVYFSLYIEQGRKPDDLSRSVANFHQATEIDPTFNLAFRGLGFAERASGRTDEAIAAWEKAVVADRGDEISTLNLGLAYFGKGDKSRALQHFERYLELKGDRISSAEKEKISDLIEQCKK